MLDVTAAATLFAIVIAGTNGPECLAKQKPWQVKDQGDAFLVVGTPFTQGKLLRYVKCHVFFAKADAEVLGIGCDGRQILSRAEESDWRRKMTPAQFDAVFGETFEWERDGVRDAIRALYGGVVNTPADAVAYAKVFLQTTLWGATMAQGLLTAEERGGVWHIARVHEGKDLLAFSRTSGKILSSFL